MRYNPKCSHGFTLIELSAVVIILSLLLAGVLTIQNQKVRRERLEQTNMKLEAIGKALQNYRLLHNKLPCPGDSSLDPTDGTEKTRIGLQADGGDGSCHSGTNIESQNNTTGGTPDVFGGTVPVVTLGLPADYNVDGWGNMFSYHVDRVATIDFGTGGTDGVTLTSSLIVEDESGTAITGDIFAAVISHGENGHGAFMPVGGSTRKSSDSQNTNEQGNCMCDDGAADALTATMTITVARRNQNPTDASDSFDDIVSYFPRKFFYNSSELNP